MSFDRDKVEYNPAIFWSASAALLILIVLAGLA